LTQKLVITVDPSESGTGLVTVQDVLAHVLELFELVIDSDPTNEGLVAWRLVSATMNSPFTVTAEAVPRYPGIPVDRIAESQVRAFAHNYAELRSGQLPEAWAEPEARRLVSRLLARSSGAITFTRISAIEGAEIDDVEITPSTTSVESFGAVTVSAQTPPSVKMQVGSIEGRLLQVQRWYQQPAVQIEERKTKQKVWCVVPEEFQHEISETTRVEDVWHGSRVVVKGKIFYGADGKIARVVASNVRRVEPVDVPDDAIVDKEFTGGLSASEYLERFRDGKLGRS
jgi:hypothetical protein